MMPKTKRQSKTAKKCWSESFGVYGATIRIAEPEPGGVLYLLWLDKKGKQQKRSLGHRDRREGKREALAAASAMMQANAAVRGVVVINPQPQPERQTKQDAPAPLTLAQGVARMFDPLKGAYATVNEHVRQAKRYTEAAVALLDQDLTWEDFTAGTMMYLVRLMAQRSRDGSGANAAEKTCVMLYAVASWLRQEGLIPDSAAIPKANWKVKLREEWRALTGHRVEVQRPRHQVDEVAAIFAALPKADPRLRLLIELAAELRAGQAVRAKRSDLILDEQVGGFGLGRFIVHGAGKKHGETVDLHPELRALVDEVLSTGYLSEAEAAYQSGEISDYFLFPTGKLQGGAYVPLYRATDKPLSDHTLREKFGELEAIAGVEHRRGRAFYGLRRQATDLAPEFAQDAQVLNRISGHSDSATRERIYQDPQNERVRARAAEARRNMRAFLTEADQKKAA
jgi:integrase